MPGRAAGVPCALCPVLCRAGAVPVDRCGRLRSRLRFSKEFRVRRKPPVSHTICLGFAKAVACDTSLKVSLALADDAALCPLFLDRALSTLLRHSGGWRAWIWFCASENWSIGSPSFFQVFDFTVSLVEKGPSLTAHVATVALGSLALMRGPS